MMRGVLIAALAVSVTGCGGLGDRLTPAQNRVLFEGKYYPARVTRDRDDRAAFAVTVSRAGQGLSGAREAGRYAAVKYCLDQYGNSDAVWSLGPDSDGVTVSNDQITLAGRCAG